MMEIVDDRKGTKYEYRYHDHCDKPQEDGRYFSSSSSSTAYSTNYHNHGHGHSSHYYHPPTPSYFPYSASSYSPLYYVPCYPPPPQQHHQGAKSNGSAYERFMAKASDKNEC